MFLSTVGVLQGHKSLYNDFLDMTSKRQATKGRIDKLDFVKINFFFFWCFKGHNFQSEKAGRKDLQIM